MFSPKNTSQNLSIREIHKLYLTLKSGLPKKDEPYLLHEAIQVLQGISTEQFKDSLRILHGNKFDSPKNPIDVAVQFIDGLKKSQFFAYHQFLSGLLNGRS